MEVYQLVGKEARQYVKDGQQKFYNGLHMVSMQGMTEGVDGSVVQKVTCPSGIDPARLKIGEWYEMIYQLYDTAKGKMARLVDLRPYEGA